MIVKERENESCIIKMDSQERENMIQYFQESGLYANEKKLHERIQSTSM